MSDPGKIEHNFAYHQPKNEAVINAHEQTREACKVLALYMDNNIPDCREKSLAITKIEEAMFWANAGIARENAK